MSKLFRLLEEKALNPNTANEYVFVEMPERAEVADYDKCLGITYKAFFAYVKYFMDALRHDYTITSIVFVDNSVASNALIIALREIGINPVLIDVSSRRILGNSDIPIPYIYRKDNRNSDVINSYVRYCIDGKLSPDTKGDIIICSSGSEGLPHFYSFTEEELINMKNQYGENGSTFYSYISSANISGLLTNLINPLAHDCKAVIRTKFDLAVFDKAKKNKDIVFDKPLVVSKRNAELVEKLFYGDWDYKVVKLVGDRLLIGQVIEKPTSSPSRLLFNFPIGSLKDFGLQIDSMMLPRDISEFLDKYDCSNLDMSHLKHIYLAGGVNSKETIEKIRTKILSINEGVLENLYGATEAGGVITIATEKDLKPCYIDASNCMQGEIIYTFDKTNFFSVQNGVESRVEREFSEDSFIEFIPVSNKKESNVRIKNDFTIVFKDATGNNEIESTDVGVYINDQLYVIGRKSSFVTVNDQNYFLDGLEHYFSQELGVPVYCAVIDTYITLFLNCGDMSLDKKRELYKKALDYCDKFKKIKLTYPVILDSDSFPKIEISGKISRSQFVKYKNFIGQQHYHVALGKYAKERLFNEIIKKNFIESNIEHLDDFTIRVKVPNNQYFFDFAFNSNLFDVVSFDDAKGEIVLRFNDNYMFDIHSVNLLNEYPEFAKLTSKSTVLAQILMDGVDWNSRRKIKESSSIYDVYREIDSNMSTSEIINQLRLNVAVAIYDSLPVSVRRFFPQGIIETCRDLVKNGTPIEGVKEAIAYAESTIGKENVEKLQKTMEKYYSNVLYAPGRANFNY